MLLPQPSSNNINPQVTQIAIGVPTPQSSVTNELIMSPHAIIVIPGQPVSAGRNLVLPAINRPPPAKHLLSPAFILSASENITGVFLRFCNIPPLYI
jgi:hypothetical protein